MHRLSAMDNPDAPLSHHWQDSTHVTFGVVTVGAVWRDLKIEGSTFKGREPDEVRYDFDERSSIRSADGSPGIRRRTWRCRFRMVISTARKSWNRRGTSTAPPHSYIIDRSVRTRTGRTPLSGGRTGGAAAISPNLFPFRDELSARAEYLLRAVRARRKTGTRASPRRSGSRDHFPHQCWHAGVCPRSTHRVGDRCGPGRTGDDPRRA
jgi:hypothetical protein